jgi:hypothetical protein
MNFLTISTKTSLVISLTIFLLTVSYSSFDRLSKRPDFSGTWKLNIQKSQFNEVPYYAAVKQFTISQQENTISITRTLIDAESKEITTKEYFTMNGKPNSSVVVGQKTKVSLITWSEGEEVLILNTSYSKSNKPEEIDYKLFQTWQLTNGDKELVVDLTTPGYKIKAIYDRE